MKSLIIYTTKLMIIRDRIKYSSDHWKLKAYEYDRLTGLIEVAMSDIKRLISIKASQYFFDFGDV